MEYRDAIAVFGAAWGRELAPGAAPWMVEWCEARQKKIAHEGGEYSEQWPDAPRGSVAVLALAKEIREVSSGLPEGAPVTLALLEATEEKLRAKSEAGTGRLSFLCEPD